MIAIQIRFDVNPNYYFISLNNWENWDCRLKLTILLDPVFRLFRYLFYLEYLDIRRIICIVRIIRLDLLDMI